MSRQETDGERIWFCKLKHLRLFYTQLAKITHRNLFSPFSFWKFWRIFNSSDWNSLATLLSLGEGEREEYWHLDEFPHLPDISHQSSSHDCKMCHVPPFLVLSTDSTRSQTRPLGLVHFYRASKPVTWQQRSDSQGFIGMQRSLFAVCTRLFSRTMHAPSVLITQCSLALQTEGSQKVNSFHYPRHYVNDKALLYYVLLSVQCHL